MSIRKGTRGAPLGRGLGGSMICRCKGCGYLSSQHTAACPYCGGECEEIADAVELAVRKVMQLGGEVEVLGGDQVVGQFDQIGALLRY